MTSSKDTISLALIRIALTLNAARKHRRSAALIFALACAAAVISGCARQSAAEVQKSTPPAKVENAKQENELATVTLTPEAEARLGIRVEAIGYQDVSRTRTFSGEAVLPPDSTATVSAPITGTLLGPTKGQAPASGMKVRKGQTIFRLMPLISPAEQDQRALFERDVALAAATAANEVTAAATRVEAARVRATRAEQLVRDKGGSVKAAEQAQEEVRLAEIALDAARQRLELTKRTPSYTNTPITIQAPQTAVVQRVYVAPGQTVASGAVLFDVADFQNVLIRVPVYVGELNLIEQRRPAQIHGLADASGSPVRFARPVAAPPTADPNSATADLYFALPNRDAALRPGQRVGVTLQLKAGEDGLAVPWSAVLHDVDGGTWVYEAPGSGRYVRRRVAVRRVNGDMAALESGLSVGTKIVTTGASELFGTEFGPGK